MDQNNYYAPQQPQQPQQPYQQPYQQQYQQPYQQPYQQQYQQPMNQAPVAQLRTDRGLIKLLLLSLITFGIYGIIYWAKISEDVNLVCSRYDGKKTMNYYLLFFIVTPLTFGIGSIVWMHKLYERVGNELRRRNVNYSISAGTFWLWTILGSFIIVGPFVAVYKLLQAMNHLNADYNQRG